MLSRFPLNGQLVPHSSNCIPKSWSIRATQAQTHPKIYVWITTMPAHALTRGLWYRRKKWKSFGKKLKCFGYSLGRRLHLCVSTRLHFMRLDRDNANVSSNELKSIRVPFLRRRQSACFVKRTNKNKKTLGMWLGLGCTNICEQITVLAFGLVDMWPSL